jgi:hypothetical protein
MAFPFEALDFFLPEIAHWMAGKSPSERVRMHRAGRGLLMLGLGVACVTLLLPGLAQWAFGSIAWAWMLAALFGVCGAGLLLCVWAYRRVKSPRPPQ